MTVDMVASQIAAFFEDIPKGDIYLAEARFGLSQMKPVLDGLPAGGRVLEVGSGPCIALSSIVRLYPHLQVQGIEPMSDGFAFFDDFIARMQTALTQTGTAPFDLHRGGYEDFPAEGNQWDVIFLVNVLEHLPDWRDFVGFVARHLAPGGRCIVLCPNYSFPYESHFGLPIIATKSLTRRVFAKQIAQFELERDYGGLYDSLNFVKLRQVRPVVRAHGLGLVVQTDIIREMVDRLDTDPAFAKRQKALSGAARLLKRTGLLRAALRMPLLQNVLPYMKLELTKPV